MSSSFTSLPLIPRIFASGGTTQDPIPETVAEGSNRASYQMGWPEVTSTPIDEGGIPPNRLDFNGLGTLLTTYLYALQNGQYITFNSSVSTKIGGYPLNAVLWYINNGVPQYMVRSLVANNTTSDLTDTTKWQPVTLNPMGMAMLGTLSSQTAAQVRNIEIVNDEPATGTNGTIYAIAE